MRTVPAARNNDISYLSVFLQDANVSFTPRGQRSHSASEGTRNILSSCFPSVASLMKYKNVCCFCESLSLSQVPCSTYQDRSPSSRRNTRASSRVLRWHWSGSFTPPGTSTATTDVIADGCETAVCASPSVPPGGAAEASPKQACAHLDSRTRRPICTEPIAIGSP